MSASMSNDWRLSVTGSADRRSYAERSDAASLARWRFAVWGVLAGLIAAAVYGLRLHQLADWAAASPGFYHLTYSPWGAIGLALLPAASLACHAGLTATTRLLILGTAALMVFVAASITVAPFYAIADDELLIHSGLPWRADVAVPVSDLRIERSGCETEDRRRRRTSHTLALIVTHPALPGGRFNLARDVRTTTVGTWLRALELLEEPAVAPNRPDALAMRCLIAMRGGLDPAAVDRFDRLLGADRR